MRIQVLQLNTYGGKYWDLLSSFLHTHSYDVLQLQEVVGQDTRVGNISSQENTYSKLENILNDDYHGRLLKTETFSSSPTSFDGVATFVKKNITILEEKTIIQKEGMFPFSSDRTDFENIGRGALVLRVKKEDKNFSLINTHLAWSPTAEDTNEKMQQARILSDFLRTLRDPYIFSGDLNVTPQTKTIQLFNRYGKNLTELHHISNTLSPLHHTASHLFPPGIAVDYIFVSPSIEVMDFGVVQEDISDHLGLFATLSI